MFHMLYMSEPELEAFAYFFLSYRARNDNCRVLCSAPQLYTIRFLYAKDKININIKKRFYVQGDHFFSGANKYFGRMTLYRNDLLGVPRGCSYTHFVKCSNF